MGDGGDQHERQKDGGCSSGSMHDVIVTRLAPIDPFLVRQNANSSKFRIER